MMQAESRTLGMLGDLSIRQWENTALNISIESRRVGVGETINVSLVLNTVFIDNFHTIFS